jgi:tetratricopeptide (TPR) repeat protein
MAESPPCFCRFRVPDVEVTKREVEDCRRRIDHARKAGHEAKALDAMIQLGFLLTPLDCEKEAVQHLEEALALARRAQNHTAEVAAILHLATALQYCGDRERAQQLFREGLERAQAYEIVEFDHFFHHHRGRCCVEQGQLVEARQAFETALALREPLGEPRFIMSTMAALEELDRMEGKC